MTNKRIDPAYLSPQDAELLQVDAPPCGCVGCTNKATHRSGYEAIKGVRVWMCDGCDDYETLPGNDNSEFLPQWEALTKDRSVDDE